jgi:hypothetical protein
MRKPFTHAAKAQIDSPVTESRPSAELDAIERRRSPRVMLQIPVQLFFHTPDGRDRRHDAFTLVVNAHGCLLAMEVQPPAGVRMRLANPRSGVQHTGTVIRAARARDGSFAVSFEFDQPAPDLWSLGLTGK